VQADAYATFVKLAELVGLYDNLQVLIIGIATPMGTPYNKQLSERGAELVKQILVENFDLAADRLATKVVFHAAGQIPQKPSRYTHLSHRTDPGSLCSTTSRCSSPVRKRPIRSYLTT
jgi:hypothetical protein